LVRDEQGEAVKEDDDLWKALDFRAGRVGIVSGDRDLPPRDSRSSEVPRPRRKI
jgi:hypothetical protein